MGKTYSTVQAWDLSSIPASTEKTNSGGGPIEQWGTDKNIMKPEAFTWQPL